MQRNGGNTLRTLPHLACAKSCGNPCKSMTYGERNFPAIKRSRTLPGVSTPLRPARCTGLQTAFMGWSRGSRLALEKSAQAATDRPRSWPLSPRERNWILSIHLSCWRGGWLGLGLRLAAGLLVPLGVEAPRGTTRHQDRPSPSRCPKGWCLSPPL